MLIYEFVERTGYFPKSMKEWKKIETEYMLNPKRFSKDQFCEEWAERNKKKVREQQETTTCYLNTYFFDYSTTLSKNAEHFNVFIEKDLRIRKDIRGTYDYSSAIINYMRRKSFGYKS